VKPLAVVISVQRTPERLAWFRAVNASQAAGVETVAGVDGIDLEPLLQHTRLIDQSALASWSRGAIGAALSHLLCWRRCAESDRPLLVLEDDVVLAHDWIAQLDQLCASLNERWDLILLGWNYNSVLRSVDASGSETTSLFEPAYPNLDQIHRIINPPFPLGRQIKRLKNGFGLPAYLISSECARQLLNLVPPLQTRRITVSRGIPVVDALTLDGLLNSIYSRIGAYVVDPPLAIAINDPTTSLTQQSHCQVSFSG
jgi:glycosyl transferase family 25